jgi:hypothetical protein
VRAEIGLWGLLVPYILYLNYIWYNQLIFYTGELYAQTEHPGKPGVVNLRTSAYMYMKLSVHCAFKPYAFDALTTDNSTGIR